MIDKVEKKIISVGEKAPGWQGPFEGGLLAVIRTGLQLVVSLTQLSDREVEGFRTLTGYGVYKGRYPLPIWGFPGLSVDTPFDPCKESLMRPNMVRDFLLNPKQEMLRILIDERGIVRALCQSVLDREYVRDLADLWSDPKTDWQGYDRWYEQTMRTSGIDHLASKLHKRYKGSTDYIRVDSWEDALTEDSPEERTSKYPQALPVELREKYIYTPDGGHSIQCVLKQHFAAGRDMSDFLVPVPVKAVLRGYEIIDGYAVVDLPYDTMLGLIVPEEDTEF